MSSDASTLVIIEAAIQFALGVVVVAAYSYGAIWAFRIRKALMSPLYKQRARWVGVVAIFFAVLIASNLLIKAFAENNFLLSLLEYSITDAAGIVTLAWIDTTIKVARRSDPLNRNTIKWKQLRYVIWAFTFITTAGSLFTVVYFRVNFFTSPNGTSGAFVSGSFGWVLFGFIALVLSSRRSRDPILQEHLKWFGLFLFVLFLVDTVLSHNVYGFILASEALLALDAYFLYRGVKSLAPFSRVPLEEMAKPTS
jgi:hypothetical protein